VIWDKELKSTRISFPKDNWTKRRTWRQRRHFVVSRKVGRDVKALALAFGPFSTANGRLEIERSMSELKSSRLLSLNRNRLLSQTGASALVIFDVARFKRVLISIERKFSLDQLLQMHQSSSFCSFQTSRRPIGAQKLEHLTQKKIFDFRWKTLAFSFNSTCHSSRVCQT